MMTTPDAPESTPQETILYTLEIESSDLAHSCLEQIEALAAFAGMSTRGTDMPNESWYGVLAPIAERLEMLCILQDQQIDSAELRLVVLTNRIKRGPVKLSGISEPLKAARKAAKTAQKAFRKERWKNRYEALNNGKVREITR